MMTVTAIKAAVISKALAKGLDLAITLAGAAAKQKLQDMRAEKALKKVSKNLEALQKVKTLLHTVEPVPLSAFYYPACILDSSQSKRSTPRQVMSLSEFPVQQNLLIEGTVGQGKSIFLRWLACEELRLAGKIPVFYELRRLSKHVSLMAGLLDTLKSFGLTLDEAAFRAMAAAGAVTVFLDGFDEVPVEIVGKIAIEIEELCATCPKTQIVASSRLDCALRSSTHFKVLQLAPLTQAEHEGFLRRVAQADGNHLDQLVQSVARAPTGIKEILTTPLTMTLLLLVYKSEYDIPPTLAKLYEKLFWAIVTRHENGKLGNASSRRTKTGDSELVELFRAFSFYSKVQRLKSIDEKSFAAIFGKAKIAVRNATASVEQFRDDMIKHVCLLQNDGLEITFAHPSIQEYFAAEYIQLSESAFAEKYYGQVRSKRQWDAWRQELIFLTDIDRYRYLKYFFVPDTQAFLRAANSEMISWRWLVDEVAAIGCHIAPNGRMTITSVGSSVTSAQDRFRLHIVAAVAAELRKRPSAPPIPERAALMQI